MSSNLDKIHKIYALYKRGVGGEKHNAEALLKNLLKKSNLTLKDYEAEFLNIITSVDIVSIERPWAYKVGKYWALYIDGVDVLKGKKAIHCGLNFERCYYNYTNEEGVTSDNIYFNIPNKK